MALKEPMLLKRKRTLPLVLSLVGGVGVSVWLTLGRNFSSTERGCLIAVTAVFFLSAAFQILLISETTYLIDDTGIECLSRFLPKEKVEAKDITRVEYTEDRKGLVVHYDRPEYNLRSVLADAISPEDKTGMWLMTVRKEDINRPLGEVKYALNALLLAKEQIPVGEDKNESEE